MRVVIKDRRKWAIVAVAVLLGGAYLAYRHYVSSPYFIKERAVKALLSGDCETLCRLTDEEELKRLNLTPEIVCAVLKDVLGLSQLPPRVGDRLVEPPMPDQMTWNIYLQGDPIDQPHYPYLSILLIYTPKGWKLLLSKILYGVCIWKLVRAGYKYEQTLGLSVDILRRHGIRGLRAEDGGFNLFGKEEKEW
ncbi:MAG: hypothetical protein HZLCBSQH_001328 [Candidatus Fervidibacterota bacterium]